MTAPFAAELCGFRDTGHPSTSDANDHQSVEFGHALFRELDVAPGTPAVAQVGTAMENKVKEHLATLRPDLVVAQSRMARSFEQYKHLDVFRRFESSYGGHTSEIELLAAELLEKASQLPENLVPRLLAINEASLRDHQIVQQLVDTMPQESLLKIDITVAAPPPVERLLVGLSSKWTFRTDRAQDPVSQGAKLVNLRRGHMPHFAVLTMEPRPAMLRLVAYGSGAVDCVYHLALPELQRAAASLEAARGNRPWAPRLTLERMVAQGRVRSYEQLVEEVLRLPKW